jgi:hypothetical protein
MSGSEARDFGNNQALTVGMLELFWINVKASMQK